MVYIMRRLFTKFKQEVSLDSTYSYWVKFCFVEHDKVTSPQPSEKGSSIGSAVQIKSYSHFEEIIASVYRNNSNKRHTIIEIILQKENKLGKITTSSVKYQLFRSHLLSSVRFSTTAPTGRPRSCRWRMILRLYFMPSRTYPKAEKIRIKYLGPLSSPRLCRRTSCSPTRSNSSAF